MNREALSTAAVVLALIAGAVWAYFNFERVTERTEVGYQGDAQRNRFLAAQRLFERMGLPAREVRNPAELDALSPRAALFLPRHRGGLPAERIGKLLRWVDGGGHLIVEAEPHEAGDAMLDALGIERVGIRNRSPRAPSSVTLPHAAQPLRVHFGYAQKLLPAAAPEYGYDDVSGTHLVHLRRGNGMVTVLAEASFMANSEIAKHDHAEFAWQIARFAPARDAALFAIRLETPTLLEWLREHAVAALALAAALLAAWLWRVAPRFGPVEPDPPPGRRRLLDHLRASGRFQWARRQARHLLDAARDACLNKVARSHPGILDLARAERIAHLAAITQIGAGQIELALYGEAREAAEFTDAIRVLQRIEDRLVRKIAG